MFSALFGFEGRMKRLPYFLRVIGASVVVAFAGLAWVFIDIVGSISQLGAGIGLVMLAAALAVLLSATWRRFHDLGTSGKYAWLALVPLLNLALFALLAWYPGDRVANEYGPAD